MVPGGSWCRVENVVLIMKGYCGPGEDGGGTAKLPPDRGQVSGTGDMVGEGGCFPLLPSSTPTKPGSHVRVCDCHPSGGDALSLRPLPSPGRGVMHAQQSHPGGAHCPLPMSAFLPRVM